MLFLKSGYDNFKIKFHLFTIPEEYIHLETTNYYSF